LICELSTERAAVGGISSVGRRKFLELQKFLSAEHNRTHLVLFKNSALIAKPAQFPDADARYCAARPALGADDSRHARDRRHIYPLVPLDDVFCSGAWCFLAGEQGTGF
jgi:hypothetical protein